MLSPIRTLALAATVSIAVGSTAFAAPAAKQYQSTITSPTTVTGATITITKPSKIIAKVATDNVTFQLKLAGVVDGGDNPVDLVGNQLQIDVIISGSLHQLNFNFDLASGKVSQKFTTANPSLGGVGVVAGQPFEIRGVRLIQGAPNFNSFGVAGLTAK